MSFKHLRIALEAVWIHRRHHAAAAQGIELHKRVSDAQLRALPERFGIRLDPSNEDVRSKASDDPPPNIATAPSVATRRGRMSNRSRTLRALRAWRPSPAAFLN